MRSGDLIVAVVFAAIGTIVGTLAGDNLAFRAPLAAPLVFVAPGYSVTAALFPRPLDWADWVLLTPSLAIAVVVLGGLFLNVTPWGLSASSWAVLLFLVTVIACAVAAWRRRRTVAVSLPQAQAYGSLRPRQVLAFTAAALVTGVAIWLARQPVPQQPEQGYALLWALPDPAGQQAGVHVGVQSLQPTLERYDLRIVADGQTLQQLSIDLQPAETWEADISLATPTSGTVEAQLYRAAAPDVAYRRAFVRLGS
jgi:uncharacterized membrane protein